MIRTERRIGEELDSKSLRDWFNVDFLNPDLEYVSQIRHGLVSSVRKNWSHIIKEDKDYIDFSRELLEAGRDVVVGVLSPASYGNDKISESIAMVERGEDPLRVEQVLDQIPNEDFAGISKLDVIATAYLSFAFQKGKQVHLRNSILEAGIPLLAQAIAARSLTAQNPQS